MTKKLSEILQDIDQYRMGVEDGIGQFALTNLYHLAENLQLLVVNYERRLEALEADLRMRQPLGPVGRQLQGLSAENAQKLNAAMAEMIAKAIAEGWVVSHFDGAITIKK